MPRGLVSPSFAGVSQAQSDRRGVVNGRAETGAGELERLADEHGQLR